MSENNRANFNLNDKKKNTFFIAAGTVIVFVLIILGVYVEVSHQNQDYSINPNNQKTLYENAKHLVESESTQLHQDQTVPFSQAQFYFKNSNFSHAYPALLPYAVGNSPIAQLEVGFLNEFGLGTTQDYQKAALWYYLAISPNQYNEHSMSRGIDYYFGLKGKTKNMQKAALWFRMAAELSNDQY